MRVLVTGAAGFVAPYLAHELEAHRHEVILTDLRADVALSHYYVADLCDAAQVRTLVRDTRPDACVHLAGISFVPEGNRDPSTMLHVNVDGTTNLLQAFEAEIPEARFLFVSTAQVYGCTPQPDVMPVKETEPLNPLSPYANSKCACERAVVAAGQNQSLHVFIARPTNHTGPGQTEKFFLPSLIAQAKRIQRGEATSFEVGNLDSGRDFCDVRDVVVAYRLILECGKSGEVYNISANAQWKLRDVLKLIQKEVGIDAPIHVDPSRVRPTDFSRVLDISNLKSLGWIPRYSLQDTIQSFAH